jgi:hypothetical protein
LPSKLSPALHVLIWRLRLHIPDWNLLTEFRSPKSSAHPVYRKNQAEVEHMRERLTGTWDTVRRFMRE